MSVTEPIRNSKELKNFIDYYKYTKNNPRNRCLIIAGLNTALRISDLLNLNWNDVFDFKRNKFRKHIRIVEVKTEKVQQIVINETLLEAFSSLKNSLSNVEERHFIFAVKYDPYHQISRVHAYRIIKRAAANTLSDSSHISCHSLRKTFGYFAYKNGTSPVLLMSIYNHSSFEITKRYLGINQDEKDDVFLSINFDESESENSV